MPRRDLTIPPFDRHNLVVKPKPEIFYTKQRGHERAANPYYYVQ